MLGLERADFQIEGDESAEKAVVEEQVNKILLLPERKPVLPADKAEAVTKFQEEGLQPGGEPVSP